MSKAYNFLTLYLWTG